jgi:signal transduction histidine kinase
MSAQSKRSIRWWLAILAVTGVLPLVLLLAMVFMGQVRTEQREARDAALRIAQSAASRMRELHLDSVGLLQRMAMRPAIRAANPQDCDSLFAIVDFFPQYLNLFLLDRSGGLLCAASPQEFDRATSQEAQEWIKQQIRTGELKAGKPAIRHLGNAWVSILAADVTSPEGKLVGTLVLAQLPDIRGPEGLPPGSVITIIDSEGRVQARSVDPERWTGMSVRGTEVTEIVLKHHEGRARAHGIDGVPRHYGFTSIPEMGWFVYVGVPDAAVMRPVRRLFIQGAIVSFAILLLAFAAARALSRFVERPINDLVRAAGSIAREGYGGTVPVDGPREIAALGEAFNHMVESRSQAEARIVASEQNLKALSDRLLVVQEQERTRIAREIHDDLGQSLTALKMDVGGLLERREGSSDAIRDRIVRTIDATVQAVQRISAELRPSVLDDLGLVAAIDSEARLFEERTGIECDVSVAAEPAEIEGPLATAIYRIIQEALTNVARHSHASRVEIRLRSRPDEILLEVRDDGRGIRKEQVDDGRSFGLMGIRERAATIGGTVRFEGIEERGTIVSVRIPTEVKE